MIDKFGALLYNTIAVFYFDSGKLRRVYNGKVTSYDRAV